jgi:hypothetical protein
LVAERVAVVFGFFCHLKEVELGEVILRKCEVEERSRKMESLLFAWVIGIFGLEGHLGELRGAEALLC